MMLNGVLLNKIIWKQHIWRSLKIILKKNIKLKQIGFSAEFSMTQCRFWNIGLEGMAVDL